jgi:hypothetical protein
MRQWGQVGIGHGYTGAHATPRGIEGTKRAHMCRNRGLYKVGTAGVVGSGCGVGVEWEWSGSELEVEYLGVEWDSEMGCVSEGKCAGARATATGVHAPICWFPEYT